jgi:hypothetical protein
MLGLQGPPNRGFFRDRSSGTPKNPRGPRSNLGGIGSTVIPNREIFFYFFFGELGITECTVSGGFYGFFGRKIVNREKTGCLSCVKFITNKIFLNFYIKIEQNYLLLWSRFQIRPKNRTMPIFFLRISPFVRFLNESSDRTLQKLNSNFS